GFRYTRYADDLSFSASGAPAKNVGKILSQVEWLVAEEGFKIHPSKIKRKIGDFAGVISVTIAK
ncbi:MAG: RNA-directed DNA polymerase, partial [Candidatus Lindowbacteria bacterium]|nr:RNA-directed DNA polymerase [Candidatus Lindowbacteria bacterium]